MEDLVDDELGAGAPGPTAPDTDDRSLSPELARALVEHAPDGIVVVDSSGAIVLANPAAAAIFGRSVDDLEGRPVDDLLPHELRAVHAAHRHDFAAAPRVRPMGAGLDLRGRRPDGTQVPVEIALSPLRSEGEPLVVAIVRDITERRETATQLQHAAEAIALSEERERIARDLHDRVVQRLFATGLVLQATSARVPDADAQRRLEEAVDDIDATIREVRTSIFALRSPPAASSARAAVLDTARDATRALGCEPRVTFDGPVDTLAHGRVREELVATLREALANVARHAGAHRVDVAVSAGDEVRLLVADDGRGLPDELPRVSGIDNMTARALGLGGRCTVARRESGGTLVDWVVPAPPSTREDPG